MNKAWTPACNVVDIGSRSCTTSSVISAMQGERLKKIVFRVKCDFAAKQNVRELHGMFIDHLTPAQTAILFVFLMESEVRELRPLISKTLKEICLALTHLAVFSGISSFEHVETGFLSLNLAVKFL